MKRNLSLIFLFAISPAGVTKSFDIDRLALIESSGKSNKYLRGHELFCKLNNKLAMLKTLQQNLFVVRPNDTDRFDLVIHHRLVSEIALFIQSIEDKKSVWNRQLRKKSEAKICMPFSWSGAILSSLCGLIWNEEPILVAASCFAVSLYTLFGIATTATLFLSHDQEGVTKLIKKANVIITIAQEHLKNQN